MLQTILFTLLISQPIEDTCKADISDYLDQSADTFDQTDTGWRGITANNNCYKEAAILIEQYRSRVKDTSPLRFHEGQLRAYAGENDAASKLILSTLVPADRDIMGHNHYKKATVAFLNQDREVFEEHLTLLKALPKPDNFILTDQYGNPVKRPWPLNYGVLKRLDDCWGKANYEQAYRSGCIKAAS